LDTTRPAGKESINPMLINDAEEFGLVMLKVNDVLPFKAKLAVPKALEAVGGVTIGAACTVSVAVLLATPGPLSLAEIGPVTLLNVPVVAGVAGWTSTEMKHEPLDEGWLINLIPLAPGELIVLIPRFRSCTAAPKSPPVKVIVVDPGSAVTVPSQVLES